MALATRTLSSVVGAEITGADIAEGIDDATFGEIHRALLDHTIVVLKGQERMTPAQHVAFSQRFGDLEGHTLSEFTLPDEPKVFIVSNMKKDGKPIGASGAGMTWHTDSYFIPVPSALSLLHAKIVPPAGGETAFANMYEAYDRLPARLKERIVGKEVLVSRVRAYPKTYAHRPPLTEEQKAKLPDVVHPLVRTHPETGRHSLYLGGQAAWEIVGETYEDSQALFDELRSYACDENYAYAHQWTEGDLVIWDNRCALHQARPFDAEKHDRLMYRTTVAGTVPFFRENSAAA